MAIAAAAIGFAANQTSGTPLRGDHALLGVALLFWGLSFYFGCQNRLLHLSYLENHFWRDALTVVAEGELAEKGEAVPADAVRQIAKVIDDIDSGVEKSAVDGTENFRYQYQTFLFGTALYVSWHVWDMALHRSS